MSFQKLTTEEFVKRAKKLHGKLYDYSKTIYFSANQHVEYSCNSCGAKNSQKASNHLSGHGCSSNSCINKRRKSTFYPMTAELTKQSTKYNQKNNKTQQFIKDAIIKHGNKFNYGLTTYNGCKVKVQILCKNCNNVFEQTPNSHKNGSGCPNPICVSLKISQKKTKNSQVFFQKAQKLYKQFDYSVAIKNYKNTETPIEFRCTIHNYKFKQSPRNHLLYVGCKYCGKTNLQDTQMFIEMSTLIHGFRYDYSKVNYVNNKTPVTIVCKKHGNFSQVPKQHKLGNGCPKCHYDNLAKLFCKPTEQFIKEAKAIHGTKILLYNETEYKGRSIPVKIICKKHGAFWLLPTSHLFQKSSCPRCCPYGASKVGIKWIQTMSVVNGQKLKSVINRGEYRINLNRPDKYGRKFYRVDGYDSLSRTVYEFYGDIWHGNPKTTNHKKRHYKTKETYGKLYEKTLERENQIKILGYKMITIWENHFRNRQKLLKQIRKKGLLWRT